MVVILIYILDKKDKVVGVLNNQAPLSCPYTNDFHTENIQTGVNTFEFSVPASHSTAGTLENEGSVIVSDLDGKLNQFKIKNVEETNTSDGYFKDVYAENVAISELLTDIVRPTKLPSSSLEDALAYVLNGTGHTVGDVDFLESQDVEFTEHVTVLQAIYMLAELFKAEIQFEILFVHGKIMSKLIHMQERRGTVTKQLFTYSQDLLDVTRTENTEGLVTALIGVGKDGINLAGYKASRDGITTEVETDFAESEEALQMYGKDGKHIFGVFTDSEALTKVDLFNKTAEELKVRSKPKLTYNCSIATLERITGYEAKKIRVGDTLNLQDYSFNPVLLLEARVLEVKRSNSSPEQDAVVLGDYRPLKVVTPLSLETVQKLIADVGAGEDGVDGVDGKDGKTYYTWIKYATSSDGSGMSDSPTGMSFMGIATNKETNVASNTPSEYTWSLIRGETGIPGRAGADGKSSYTHIAYADSIDGTLNFSVSDSNRKYIGMYVDSLPNDSTSPASYSWSLIRGADGSQGIQGKAGSDGKTPYLHIAYATNSTGTAGFSTTDSVGKTYIGVYTDFTQADSNVPSLYSWTLFKGEIGNTGLRGEAGTTYYTWLKYADSSTGAGMSDSPTGKKYIGLAYNKTTITESNTPSDYTWSLIQGEKGLTGDAGKTGLDGKTYYTWIKYSNSPTGAGMSDSPTGMSYIGISYNNLSQTESTTPSHYAWSLIKGEKGDKGEQGSPNSTIVNAVTTIDETGITVKDGNFGLETSKGGEHQFFNDVSVSPIKTVPFKNHLLTLPNLMFDHSFEMLESASLVSGYEHSTVVSSSEMFGRWGTLGTPRLYSDYNTDNDVPIIPFSEQMVMTNSLNYVKQGIPVIPNQTYTVSFHLKSPPDITASSTAEVYFKYFDAVGTVIGATRYARFKVPTDDYHNSSVRHALSFVVPNSVSNYNGVHVEIGLRTINTSWACFDGVQMVLGDKASLYYPDDESWKIRRGGADKYPIINAYDGGHIRVNRLDVSGNVNTVGNMFVEGVVTTSTRSWIKPTLGAGISDMGSPYEGSSYYKDAQGFVHLRGFLKGVSTGAVLFTLPVGYRPSKQRIFSTFSNSATNSTRIDIYTDGRVIATFSGAWCLLDGIMFNT